MRRFRRRRLLISAAAALIAATLAPSAVQAAKAQRIGFLSPLLSRSKDPMLGPFLQAGALVAYGPNITALPDRAAVFVDKILKGTKPADPPVEQPNTFDLAVNLKTAKVIE